MSSHGFRSTWTAILAALAVTALMSLTASPAGAAVDKKQSEIYYNEAKDYLAKGKINSAVIQLKNALQQNPGNIAARRMLGGIYLRIGDGASAEKEFRAAKRRGDKSRNLSIQLGRAYLLQGKFDKVLGEVKDDVADGESRSAALLVRGQALLALRRLKDSANAFREADRINPRDVRAKVGLAQGLVNQRQFKKAEAEIDIALSRNPKSPEALVLKGELRRLNRDFDGAVSHFDRAIAVNPNNILARLGRAAALIDTNRDDKATADLQAVFQRVPKHPLAIYLSALALSKKKDFVGAQEALLDAGATLDNHMPTVFLSGAVSYALNQMEQAINRLTRYVEAVPRNDRARKLLGAALVRHKEPRKAIEVLKPMAERLSTDAQLLTLLGSAHMQTRQFNKGAEYFRKAAEAAPNVASIRTQLALGSIARGNADDAIGQLERALDLDPETRQAAILLALVKLRKGDFDGTLAAARNLRKIMPDNPLPGNLIGAAYLGKGDVDAARKSFQETLEKKPDFHAARMNLARLEARQGNTEKADKHYRSILGKNDKHLGAMIGLAQIAARQNRRDDAVSWLTKASDANPKSALPRLRLIAYYGRVRQRQKALSVARSLNQDIPNNPRVLEALGRAERAGGEASAAVATLTRLSELRPRSARVLGLVAGAQLAAKDPAAARKTLKNAANVNPDYVPTQVALVELEMREKNYAEATRLATALQKKKPKLAVGDLLIGDILARQKKYDEAIASYARGMKKSKSPALAVRRYGARRRAGQNDKGLSELQSWVDQNDDRRARHVLASGYMRAGKHDPAIRESERLLKKEQKSPVLLNNLAWLYQQKGDRRALGYAEKALKQAPKSPAIMDTLGWILVETGDARRAVELLRKANGLAPRHGDIHYHLAVALNKAGDSRAARKELEKLIDSKVKFVNAAKAGALLKKLRGG